MVYATTLYKVLVEYESLETLDELDGDSDEGWVKIQNWFQVCAFDAESAKESATRMVRSMLNRVYWYTDDIEIEAKKAVELPQAFYMTMIGAPRLFELEAA